MKGLILSALSFFQAPRFANPIPRILVSNELSKAACCLMVGFNGVQGTC